MAVHGIIGKKVGMTQIFTADGTVTLAGRHALQRWLDATHA